MRRHTVISYFLIAFAFSWAIWIPMTLAGARVYQGSVWPTPVPGLFGPMVASFVMSGALAGRTGVVELVGRMFRLRVEAMRYLLAVSPIGFFAAAAILAAVSGHGRPDVSALGKFSGLPVVIAPGMWLLLLEAGYGEETGWRGVTVPQLLKTRSLLTTAADRGPVGAAAYDAHGCGRGRGGPLTVDLGCSGIKAGPWSLCQ